MKWYKAHPVYWIGYWKGRRDTKHKVEHIRALWWGDRAEERIQAEQFLAEVAKDLGLPLTQVREILALKPTDISETQEGAA